MHIVIVDTTLTTPPTGGAQTFLVDLTRSLVGRHHRVSIVTQPGSERRTLDALRLAGAELHFDLWKSFHLPEEKASRLANWVNAREVQIYIVSISSDVGWLTLPLLDSSIATLSIAHNDVWSFYTPLEHYGAFIDCAVAVSETIREKIVNLGSIPPNRVRYVPYGVKSLTPSQIEENVERLPAPHQFLRLGYVGRMVQEQKKVMEFLPLAEQLTRNNVRFELNLIGDGSERSVLENAFKQAGLAEQVKMWGWLSTDQVTEQLGRLDAFILLSEYEGLPVALLEAMGQGVVPIVTRIESGNTQLVRDGKNGFVVPVGDIQSCVNALQTLANDHNLLIKMKKLAWATVQTYSLESMTNAYERCFEDVLSGTKTRDYRSNLPQPFPVMPSCRSKYPDWLRKMKARLISFQAVSSRHGL